MDSIYGKSHQCGGSPLQLDVTTHISDFPGSWKGDLLQKPTHAAHNTRNPVRLPADAVYLTGNTDDSVLLTIGARDQKNVMSQLDLYLLELSPSPSL